LFKWFVDNHAKGTSSAACTGWGQAVVPVPERLRAQPRRRQAGEAVGEARAAQCSAACVWCAGGVGGTLVIQNEYFICLCVRVAYGRRVHGNGKQAARVRTACYVFMREINRGTEGKATMVCGSR